MQTKETSVSDVTQDIVNQNIIKERFVNLQMIYLQRDVVAEQYVVFVTSRQQS